MAARNFLPRCTAFFNRIAIESLRIRNWNAMHLGKKFLATIFSVIFYCIFLIVLISDPSILISLRIDLVDLFSVHDILIILLINHISAAPSFCSISFLIVQHSHPYKRIDHTYVFKTLIFVVILIFLLVSIVLIL